MRLTRRIKHVLRSYRKRARTESGRKPVSQRVALELARREWGGKGGRAKRTINASQMRLVVSLLGLDQLPL